MIAVIRDPVDRAHSNCMHLWSDGLEPEADFVTAVEREPRRIRDGYAPFWHYRGLGRYGEQLQRLYGLVPREQVLLVRYRQLVDEPQQTLDRTSRFLGVGHGVAETVAPENVKPFVIDSTRARALGRAIRVGASVGSLAPPQLWRRVSAPLVSARYSDGAVRPVLPVTDRRHVLAGLLDDIGLLEDLTGESFADWRSDSGRGSFHERRARPSEACATSGA